MKTDYLGCRWTVLSILFISAVLTGCAHQGQRLPPAHFDSLPVHSEISQTPFFSQESNQCGPAALAMALNWSGLQVTAEELGVEIYTPARKGSLQPLLISAARYYNRLPYTVRGAESLLLELAAGHPVVVLKNLGWSWYPRWHYAVVIGYNLEKQVIILRSGNVFRKETAWPLFFRTWERGGQWGLVVLPLAELPASADEPSYLAAVAALENLNKWETASKGYETALRRWPESLGALMGLGNSRYASCDLTEAAKTFQRAVEMCPTCGDAYNNLAHVLARLGYYDEAMIKAREAVSLGGSNEGIYRQTLEEILELKKGIEISQ